MKRKLVGIILASIAMFTVSCKDNKNDATKNDEKVLVDVFQFKVEFKDELKELGDLYMKEHPNVELVFTAVGGGSDYDSALKSKFVSGEEPAIFSLDGPNNIKNWESKLEDLKDSDVAKLAMPTHLKAVTIDNKVYGVPYNIEGYGFIFNKEIFKKAGIDYKKIKTYTDLENAVIKLDKMKKELGIKAVFALAGKENWVTGLHLSNIFLAPEFDGDVLKAFNSKTVEFKYKDQFKKVLDLQNKYSVQPTVSLDYGKQVEELFSLGQVAMIQQGNWTYGTIKGIDEDLSMNMGMLPIPVEGVVEDTLAVGVPAYWVINKNKDEKVKNAAKDFLNYIYSSENGKKYVVEKFNFIPAYKGFNSDSLVDPLSKTIFEYSDANKTISWVFSGYPEGFGMQVLGANIQKYLNGQASFDEILNTSKKAWEEMRK